MKPRLYKRGSKWWWCQSADRCAVARTIREAYAKWKGMPVFGR